MDKSSWPTTFEFKPFAIAPIAITVPTPITTPGSVSTVRTLCAVTGERLESGSSCEW